MDLLQFGEALILERRYGAMAALLGAGIIAGYILGQALELANNCYHRRKNQ